MPASGLRLNIGAAATPFWHAAVLYVHAALADTIPTTVIEALPCGKPVVAITMGGIPEQVLNGKNGFLAAPGDAESMVAAVARLSSNADLRRSFSSFAAADAKDYLSFFDDILSGRREQPE